jgi:RNA ligase (TIGR02306 family)
MASFKVPLTRVCEVLPHDNAERLEIVKIYDWLVVTGKGNFNPGDQVVYIPVDSILPPEVEDFLFPMTSKIKLSKHRVRSIKIRGHISQGMVVDPQDFAKLGKSLDAYHDEDDLAEYLGITKYEPPDCALPQNLQVKKKPKKGNPNFTKYTDIENFKWYDRVFQDGEQCYISEKLHGTSFRAGWYLNEANTIWKKVKKFFGLLPDWEFCWGSRNVQIQCKLYHKGYYNEDVYTKMVRKYDLMNKIPQGYAIYGEIVGDGIQKGYTYGCGPGEHKLYVYDVKYTGVKHPQQYLNYQLNTDDETLGPDHLPTFKAFIEGIGLTPVPCLYVGPFKRDILEQHRDGDSTIGGQKVREGVVLKSVWEANAACGRKCLKVISDAYYLQNDNTDFH